MKLKLNFEQVEDIMTVGEAKAAQQNKWFRVYLSYEKPEEETTDEGNVLRYSGFYMQFRPEKERITVGLSSRMADESEIFMFWEERGEDKVWEEGDFNIGYMELVKDYAEEFVKREFIIKVNGATYASWNKFAKDFGLTELIPVSTKIPKPLALKLSKVTEEEGETPSWRLRLLVQEYLTEQIKDRVRQVLFSD